MNIIDRNYLNFDRPLSKAFTPPEYKIMKEYSQINPQLNSYLCIPSQYYTKDNQEETKKYHKNLGSYEIQKRKQNLYLKNKTESDTNNYIKAENNIVNENTNKKLILKEAVIQNILKDNSLHLTSNTKCPRRIEPPKHNVDFSEVKQRSFLESKDSPEYMRMYDREQLNVIDKRYAEIGKNRQFLSRFGNWITLPPGCKDRSKALEKLSHGTYETSVLAPKWMNIKYGNIPRKDTLNNSCFKSYQGRINYRDNAKYTNLVEKNQSKAKPLYLCDTYERYGVDNIIENNRYK